MSKATSVAIPCSIHTLVSTTRASTSTCGGLVEEEAPLGKRSLYLEK